MKKVIFLLMVTLLAMGILSGCESKEETKDDVLKVSMVTDAGGVNDESFCQSAWDGLQKCHKNLGTKVSYLESKQEADFEVNLEALVDEETDLIWGIGFMMSDALLTAAKHYPENKFAIIDFGYGENTPKNVVGVTFRENEPSFLAGYIAGKMTKTNKVAFVGGMEGFVIAKFQYGYMAGVKTANPQAEVFVQYAGTFVDAAAGKSIAEQMYNNGADIIYQAAGATGNGVIEAAKENNKWVIGTDKDQNFLAPENVITSVMKHVDETIYAVVQDLHAGNWNGGTTLNYGLKEKGMGLAPTTSKLVPEDLLKEVESISEKIISGEIVVPSNEEEYKKSY